MWQPADALLATPSLLVISEMFTITRRLKRNEADYLRTFTLTATETALVPEQAFHAQTLSEVHIVLASGAPVSSSGRHSISMQVSQLCQLFIHCIYNVSLEEYTSVTQQMETSWNNTYRRRSTSLACKTTSHDILETSEKKKKTKTLFVYK